MRVLTLEEIELVAGGSMTSVTVTAPAPPGDPDPGYPNNDPGPGTGGGGGGGGGTGGGTTYTSAEALAHVKSELGMDLSNYANHSPTLLAKLTDVTNQGWHIKFHAGSSETSYGNNTIYINQDYAGNINQVTQQLSHEIGHVELQIWDNPKLVSESQYVSDKLWGEGAGAFFNAAIEHELKTSLGVDIGMASYNPAVTTPIYANEFQQYLNNPSTQNYINVTHAMGNTYGAYEHTLQNGVNETYTQHYVNEYHQLKGS